MLPIFIDYESIQRYFRDNEPTDSEEKLLEYIKESTSRIESALNLIENINTDSITELQQGLENVKDMLEYGY